MVNNTMIEKEKNSSILSPVIGRSIDKLELVVAIAKQSPNVIDEIEAVQLTLDDGSFLYLTPNTNVISLDISQTKWEDPFDQPLDAQTIQWLNEVGRPRLLDFSKFNEFKFAINRIVLQVKYIFNTDALVANTVAGIQLRVGDRYMNIYTAMEYMYIQLGEDPDLPQHLVISSSTI